METELIYAHSWMTAHSIYNLTQHTADKLFAHTSANIVYMGQTNDLIITHVF